MDNIVKEVDLDLLEKLDDGTYNKHNPSTSALQVKTSDGKSVEVKLAEKAEKTEMTIALDKKLDKTKLTVSNLNPDLSAMSEGDIWIKYE